MEEGSRSAAWRSELAAAGEAQLRELSPLIAAADPDRRVAPRSRLLCAGLGRLSQLCYEGLGGRRGDDSWQAVGRAGAMLSLVTKIDDEVIDSADFHGGHQTDRGLLRAQTAAYLEPTLRSIRTAESASAEPRCELAARLGQQLRQLARHDEARLAQLLEVIASGWQVQVDAVATLTDHPAGVDPAELRRVTAGISGAWLLMISLCGALPEGARRPLSAAEEGAFYEVGFDIQRADALADLSKDQAQGLICTYAGRLLWERAGEAYVAACRLGDEGAIYRQIVEHQVDQACLPAGRRRYPVLAGLGQLPRLLRWIHRYLTNRYLAHPLCHRRAEAAPFSLFRDDDLGAESIDEPRAVAQPTEHPCLER